MDRIGYVDKQKNRLQSVAPSTKLYRWGIHIRPKTCGGKIKIWFEFQKEDISVIFSLKLLIQNKLFLAF